MDTPGDLHSYSRTVCGTAKIAPRAGPGKWETEPYKYTQVQCTVEVSSAETRSVEVRRRPVPALPMFPAVCRDFSNSFCQYNAVRGMPKIFIFLDAGESGKISVVENLALDPVDIFLKPIEVVIMVCSICRQASHNCRKCPFKPTLAGAQPAPVGLRGALPNHQEIWGFREDRDVYSHHTRHSIFGFSPEKDHVLEIQLIDAAYFYYTAQAHGVQTRQEHSRIQELANCVENTNVTTRNINRSKKGPFTCAKNDLMKNDFESMRCGGVDSYFYKKNGSRIANKYPGLSATNWESIKREVVISYDHMNDKINKAIHVERNAEIFQDAFHEVFMSLHIVD